MDEKSYEEDEDGVDVSSYFFFQEAMTFWTFLGHSIFPPQLSQYLAWRNISCLQFSQKNRCWR
jgi:hypothetical protein